MTEKHNDALPEGYKKPIDWRDKYDQLKAERDEAVVLLKQILQRLDLEEIEIKQKYEKAKTEYDEVRARTCGPGKSYDMWIETTREKENEFIKYKKLAENPIFPCSAMREDIRNFISAPTG